jgi:hypothetical protein
MENYSLPFRGSYWVVPNVLAAGPHPLGVFEPAPPDIAERFIACNVCHFVDLTETGEYPSYLDAWHLIDGTSPNDIFSYRQFPIRDFDVPSKDLAVKILNYIDERIAEGNSAVYIHCYAGLGRTGTIVGLYLARHAIAVGKAALAKIRALRGGLPEPLRSADSPQSVTQLLMVTRWQEGE